MTQSERERHQQQERVWLAQARQTGIPPGELSARRHVFHEPVVILAGGTVKENQPNIDRFRSTVMQAFNGIKGTIISGGTNAGIAGLAGEIADAEGAVKGGRLQVLGYLPDAHLCDQPADARYTEVIPFEGEHEVVPPLQYWTDLLSSGVKPASVRLLAMDGGDIAAFEFRLALALGAWVGVVEPATRAAASLLTDAEWRDCPRLLPLPDDPSVIQAFVRPPQSSLSAEQIELTAQKIHASYLEAKHYQNPGPAVQAWETLAEDFRNANRMQASASAALLEQEGFCIEAQTGTLKPLELTPEEVERLAEREHGRWVVERLQQGWRYHETRISGSKLHPDILPWKKLTGAVKTLDRDAVRNWPKLLAQAGLLVRRRKLPRGAIPFVLAAAGHRDLAEKDELLRNEVGGLIGRIKQRMKSTPLLLLCTLDEGADRLIAEAAWERGVYIAVVLPTSRDAYLKSLPEAARVVAAKWFYRAALVIDLSAQSARDELDLYGRPSVATARTPISFIAKHCQALIALWDGSDANPDDCTFEAVRSVLIGVEYENCLEPLRGTVYQIVTPRSRQAPPADAFRINVLRCSSDLDETLPAVPKERCEKLSETIDKEEGRDESSIKASQLVNWQLVRRRGFWKWWALVAKAGDEQGGFLERNRARLWQRLVEPSPTEAQLDAFNKDASELKQEFRLKQNDGDFEPRQYPDRIDDLFSRADGLADRSHQWKRGFSQGILFFAFLAAVGFETHGEFFSTIHSLWFLFPGFIVVAFLLHLEAARRGIEDCSLDSRVLAEALRVQYFWELGGVHKPVWQHYTAHRPTELGWVISALRGLSLSSFEDHPRPKPDTATKLDVELALNRWVKKQAKWYADKSRKQHKLCKWLEWPSNAILIAVVVVSIAVGLSLSFGPRSAEHYIDSIDKKIRWAIAVASLLAGILKVWLEQEGYDEQARNYRRMSHLFAHRQQKIEQLLKNVPSGANSKDSEQVRDAIWILRELGAKALEENSIWLIMHREHPLKVSNT